MVSSEIILIYEYVFCIYQYDYIYGDYMAGAKSIKQLLIERDMSISTLAEKLGIEPQSMRNKLYRDTFSYAEMIKIADLLDADVQIVTRDTHKTF